MHYFFGAPAELTADVEKLSEMEIDVDDNVYILCRMKDKHLVSIELDYFNPIPTRSGAIFASEGKLIYSLSSFSESKAFFTGNNGAINKIYENESLDWNEMYLSQMKEFVEFVENGKKPACTFDDGLNVMKVIDSAEKSSKLRRWIKLK
jgi:predicted dehydrogenase